MGIATKTATERPIVFRAENVRAIIAGRKTQARRVMNLELGDANHGRFAGDARDSRASGLCPYGAPGDRLWVCETIRRERDGRWHYAADDTLVRPRKAPPLTVMASHGVPADTYSDGYMPRWAARLVLEITDVRVQRLHDISIPDAIAEGPPCWSCGGPIDGVGAKGCVCFESKSPARASFVMLWEKTHAETEPWASNPWVWAITFRKIDGPPRNPRKKAEATAKESMEGSPSPLRTCHSRLEPGEGITPAASRQATWDHSVGKPLCPEA